MKCDRRWWNDGAYERECEAQRDIGRQALARRRVVGIAEMIRTSIDTQRIARKFEWMGPLRIVVIVDALDGGHHESGAAATIIGVSSSAPLDETTAILQCAIERSDVIHHPSTAMSEPPPGFWVPLDAYYKYASPEEGEWIAAGDIFRRAIKVFMDPPSGPTYMDPPEETKEP
jgi:hypothetical protein